MAFPTTPVLDTFNSGASQALTARTGWATATFFGGETTLTTDAAPTHAAGVTAGTFYSNYWGTTTTNDAEAWITLGTTFSDVNLYARFDIATGNGYKVAYNSGTTSVEIDVYTAFAFSAFLGSTTQAISAGDSLGILAFGVSIEAWYKPAAGSWTRKLSFTDTTYTVTSGVIAVEGKGVVQIDAFGGGSVAGSAPARDTHTAIPFTQGAGGGGLRGGPH